MNIFEMFDTNKKVKVAEAWSQKYKSSINCSHPKGFSQKAHCAGKKKHNESVDMEMVCESCGMCETHRDHENLGEACWKGYHKEGNKKMFGKKYPNCVKNKKKTNEDASDATDNGPNVLELLRSWRNRVPAKYAWHLTKTFGDPHDATHDLAVWHDQDGFKRIEIRDEYVMHISPSPHYDYCYSYIDLQVPHKLSSALANCSESILLDHLKNEVGARCASLAANAVTLNFVMDVVAGRAQPSRDEYEKRIMNMHHDFENGKIFSIEWWPDQTHDTDPKNPYYAKKSKPEVAEVTLKEFAPNGFGGFEDDDRVPMHFIVQKELYNRRARWKKTWTISGVKLFTTKSEAIHAAEKFNKLDPNREYKYGGTQLVDIDIDENFKDGKNPQDKGDAKIRSSGRSHAHKIQAAVAMEQRARAAGKTEDASGYRKYINANKKTESLDVIEENLRDWFKDKWVRFGPDGKIRGDCARGSESEGKPKCLPKSKAQSLGKKGRASAAARKRREDPDANRSGKAINVSTKRDKK